MNKTRKIKHIAIVYLVILVSFSSVFAHPNDQSGIISWGEDIGWSIDENNHTNGTTITYDFRSGVESQYQTITTNGAAKWSIINVVQSSSSPDGEVYTYTDENTSTVASFCNYHSDSNGHLTDWDIKINTAKNATDVTMAHEFGHAAGMNDLYQSQNQDKLMYGYSSRTATGPTSSDNKGVKVITGQHTEHSFSSWTYYDSSTHRKSCSVCDGYVSGNHDYDWIIVYDTSGNDIGHVKDCVVCHDRKDSGFHIWSDWYNAGTIGEQRHCTVCQLSTETRPHDFNIYWLYGQPPTCLYEGIKVYDCKNCLYEYQEVVPALGHDWQPATCTSPSTCSRCDETTGSALGHSYGSWYTTTSPTCTSSGTERRDCTRTGCSHYETDSIPALGHNYGSWYTTTSPTCTSSGTERRDCTRTGCSHYETDSIPALGHSYGSWYTVTSPTCTESGTERRNCLRSGCSHYETDSIPALGHDWEWVTYSNYKNSDTCPYRRYWEDEKCTRCGEWHWVDRYYDVYEGHEWEWVTYSNYKNSSTCPYRRYWEDEKCTVCDEWHWVDRYYDVYEGHDWGSWIYDYGEWDYYTGEWVEYYHRVCSTCGEYDYKEERY